MFSEGRFDESLPNRRFYASNKEFQIFIQRRGAPSPHVGEGVRRSMTDEGGRAKRDGFETCRGLRKASALLHVHGYPERRPPSFGSRATRHGCASRSDRLAGCQGSAMRRCEVSATSRARTFHCRLCVLRSSANHRGRWSEPSGRRTTNQGSRARRVVGRTGISSPAPAQRIGYRLDGACSCAHSRGAKRIVSKPSRFARPPSSDLASRGHLPPQVGKAPALSRRC